MRAAKYHMPVCAAIFSSVVVLGGGCAVRLPPPVIQRITPTALATETAKPLVGKWTMAGWDFSITFVADGSLLRNVEGQATPGTYHLSQDGQRLQLQYDDGTTLDTQFALAGDVLMLTMDDPKNDAKNPITLTRSP